MMQKKGRHRRPEKIYSFDEADNRLFDVFRNHDFECPHEERHQLVRFYQLLMEQQLDENFTRLIKFKDIAIKHFIDCLIVDDLLQQKDWPLAFPLLDIGTGPGFPGIPLKIRHPESKIILAEGVRKRVDFLKQVRDRLKLENLDIVGRYIDDSFALPVRSVITRAVTDIPATLAAVKNCLEPDGTMIFMKGPNVGSEIVDPPEFRLVLNHAYTLPQTPHERRLVVYQKTGERT